MTLVGLISDTHGLLRPQAVSALSGADHILHAGDVGDSKILKVLSTVAPLAAVRGNVDYGDWADELPSAATVTIDGRAIYLTHILADLQIDPEREKIAAVVTGHTHKPLIERCGDVLFINPGSAGPRRFSLPTSVGFLRLSEDGSAEAWIENLDV
jgi:uncharacterized protein